MQVPFLLSFRREFHSTGTLTIKGKVAPSKTTGKETIRVDVTFDEFRVIFGDWKSTIVSLSWINPQG